MGPVPVRFSGSVRGALVEAELVADPGARLQSRDSQFIEDRHWLYRAHLPSDLSGGTLQLVFESLDGPCQVFVGGTRVAESANAHLPISVDLGEASHFARAEVVLAFTTRPDDLGQTGWTSKDRAFKPRFNYGWNWIPRVVQIGPARPGSALIDAVAISDLRVQSNFEPLGQGAGTVVGEGAVTVSGSFQPDVSLTVSLRRGAGDSITAAFAKTDAGGRFSVFLVAQVESWWGSQSRYQLVINAGQTEVVRKTVGFMKVEWQPVQGAVEPCEPWLPIINGRPAS